MLFFIISQTLSAQTALGWVIACAVMALYILISRWMAICKTYLNLYSLHRDEDSLIQFRGIYSGNENM